MSTVTNIDWVAAEVLPTIDEELEDRSEWCLCATVFGAVLLSLCYYNFKLNKWFDGFNGAPEERVAYYIPLSKIPEPPIH